MDDVPYPVNYAGNDVFYILYFDKGTAVDTKITRKALLELTKRTKKSFAVSLCRSKGDWFNLWIYTPDGSKIRATVKLAYTLVRRVVALKKTENKPKSEPKYWISKKWK